MLCNQWRKNLAFTSLLNHLTFNQNELIIITPNYDRLIEIACEIAGLEISTGFINSYHCINNPEVELDKFKIAHSIKTTRGKSTVQIRTKKHVKIFKPHGSLDWFKADDKIIRTSFQNKHERLIITPVQVNSELDISSLLIGIEKKQTIISKEQNHY